MNIKKLFILMTIITIIFSFKGDKSAFKIYGKTGEISSYNSMLQEAENADIIFFGEQHNNPINHWLQYELTKDIYNIVCEDLILGAEMFEADNQIIINEYLGGHHSYKTFRKEAKVWPNNKTDYQPLLDFAMSNQLTFVATNIPRRYANIVYKEGFKGLNGISKEAKKWIAPLPINYDKDLPGYLKMVEESDGHGGENLPKSQAIKDATMAHFILKNWQEGRTFIHYNGSYHSDNFEGIICFLEQQNPNLRILTIASVEQEKIDSLAEENIGIANYILCTPESMTKTY